MKIIVKYTSHDCNLAGQQTYETTLDIEKNAARRLLSAKTPYTFLERKQKVREANVLAFLIYDMENLQGRCFASGDQILSIQKGEQD